MTSNQPIIEKFTVRGLHNYKDVTIEFAGQATIIVAENGVGKTTILNMLNAFLSRRFHRLNAFTFESVHCKFYEFETPLILEKSMLNGISAESSHTMEALAREASVNEGDLTDFVLNSYIPGRYSSHDEDPFLSKLYFNSSHNWPSLLQQLDAIFFSFNNSLSDTAKLVSQKIKDIVGNTAIIFLPTYRRIERPQLRPRQIKKVLGGARLEVGSAPSPYADIVFGLADVQERLAELSEEIERRSNAGYRFLSTRILDEMLKGSAIKESEHVEISDLPDVESLSRFLSRVGKNENRLGDVFSNIETMYETREIETKENWFLRYFLSRLAAVIEQTREMEKKVEQFVNICNSYLSLSSDEKKLSFDPQTLRVVVEDLWANRTIELEALSSGEKQIVSLMARLYLHSMPKIVLIDEPELSLSLPWQRKVLPDIVGSGSVTQLLAITHSPFVYDNDLDECARPLQIDISRGARG